MSSARPSTVVPCVDTAEVLHPPTTSAVPTSARLASLRNRREENVAREKDCCS
jgi:hypothetical protein